MSEAIAEGYRAVGKHRFGMKLVAITVATVLALWLLTHFLGDSIATTVAYIAICLVWMAAAIRSILKPERDRDRYLKAMGSSPSLHRIRVENLVILIAATALAGFLARDLLNAQPPVSDSSVRTQY